MNLSKRNSLKRKKERKKDKERDGRSSSCVKITDVEGKGYGKTPYKHL